MRRWLVGVVGVALLTSCANGPPGRSAWKKELARQITASGAAPENEAQCIAQRFIDSMTDGQFADFNRRGHLNDAEKAEVADLTVACKDAATS